MRRKSSLKSVFAERGRKRKEGRHGGKNKEERSRKKGGLWRAGKEEPIKITKLLTKLKGRRRERCSNKAIIRKKKKEKKCK